MNTNMRIVDVVAAILLAVGGLNWGLVGLASFDLVAAVCGSGTVYARIIYALVGLAAVYQVMTLNAIQRRWGVVKA